MSLLDATASSDSIVMVIHHHYSFSGDSDLSVVTWSSLSQSETVLQYGRFQASLRSAVAKQDASSTWLLCVDVDPVYDVAVPVVLRLTTQAEEMWVL